jgi:lipoprotein-anchoring transpeptidase ErfK/SrfK
MDARWIDVDLRIPQHAVAMQGDLPLREALVTAGLRGETLPGSYQILRRVYNETMDSRTIPGLKDKYLLKNVLYTQYFTGDGAAIHYNWWGPPNGFGRPGSHGCLGMMFDDSKFFWEWADVGTPLSIHA